MKSIIAPLVAVALSTSGLGSAAFGQNADTVLLNGKIVTLDAAMPAPRRSRCATARSWRSAPRPTSARSPARAPASSISAAAPSSPA